MKNENKPPETAITTEEAARLAAVAEMKRVWVNMGWDKPEERLVVAEFNGFVWTIQTATAKQNDSDYMSIRRKEYTFETKFEAVVNQLKTIRRMRDAEFYALQELHALAPKSDR